MTDEEATSPGEDRPCARAGAWLAHDPHDRCPGHDGRLSGLRVPPIDVPPMRRDWPMGWAFTPCREPVWHLDLTPLPRDVE